MGVGLPVTILRFRQIDFGAKFFLALGRIGKFERAGGAYLPNYGSPSD
jgi:hypothetical protein